MADVFPKTHQQTETNFPLAFAISTYSQIGILELFLISSFDPLDSYCIHVDAKATEQVKTAVDQMIKCYQWKYPEATIFVVDDPIPVFWGHFSVLEADLKCMDLLRTKNKEWKVVFNPAGTELPLKPIGQLRRYMADFPNGIVESFPVPKANRDRFLASYELKRAGTLQSGNKILVKINRVKEPPPGNIAMKKGSKNVALSREFVNFILDDSFSNDLLKWMQDTLIPDEHFYSTIITKFVNDNHDHQNVIAGNNGGCVRLSWWYDNSCGGKSVRNVCNFGLKDLPRLHTNKKCLFANKFNLDVDSIAPIMHAVHIISS